MDLVTEPSTNIPPQESKTPEYESYGKSRKIWMYRRKVVALLAFFGFFMAYVLRTNLSIAIIDMTHWTNKTNINGTVMEREFDWNSKKRGKVLGSFFYGYIFTQVIGGWLSIKIGGAKVFGTGILITAVIAIFIPVAAPKGILVMMGMRAAQGFFQGATYPSIHSVWARWAPIDERTKLASIGFAGGFMGTMFAFPMCGFLVANYGWKFAFYVPGIMASIWAALWFIFVRDDPENDRWITIEELTYLRHSLGQTHRHSDVKHPWKSFFLSMPVWSIIVAHFCENWGFYTMVTMLPTFLHDTLDYSIRTSGLLSSTPFLLMGVGLPIAGSIVDRVRRTGKLSTTSIRKLFNCSAFIVQLVFMMLAAYARDNTRCMVYLTLAIGLGAFAWAAFSVNHLDIAAPHAGVLMGLSNMVATFSGIISPSITGYIVVDKTREEWKTVFLISCGVYLFGAIFYGLFASGEKQSWVAKVEDEKQIISQRQDSAFEFI